MKNQTNNNLSLKEQLKEAGFDVERVISQGIYRGVRVVNSITREQAHKSKALSFDGAHALLGRIKERSLSSALSTQDIL